MCRILAPGSVAAMRVDAADQELPRTAQRHPMITTRTA